MKEKEWTYPTGGVVIRMARSDTITYLVMIMIHLPIVKGCLHRITAL